MSADRQRKPRGEGDPESSGDESAATASSSARRRPAVGPPVFKGKEKAGLLKMLIARTFSSTWKPRWVKLSEGNLLIYKSHKDVAAERIFDMRSFVAVERIQDDRSNGLPWIFSVRISDKILMFQAHDERELYEWLSILAKPRENRIATKRRSVSFDQSSGTSDTIDRETVAVTHPSGGSAIVITTSSASSAANPNRTSPRNGAAPAPAGTAAASAATGPSPRSAREPAAIAQSASASTSLPIGSHQDQPLPPLLTTPKKKEPSPRTIDGPVIASPRGRTPRDEAEMLEREIRARLENELRAKFEEEMRRRVEEEVKRATERIVAEQIATMNSPSTKSEKKHKHKHKNREGDGEKRSSRKHRHRSSKSAASSNTASPREDEIAQAASANPSAPAVASVAEGSATNEIGGHSLRVKNIPPLATHAATSATSSAPIASSATVNHLARPPSSKSTGALAPQIELEPVATGTNSRRASRRGSLKAVLIGDGIFLKAENATSPRSASASSRRTTDNMSRSVSLDMRSQQAAANTLQPVAPAPAPAPVPAPAPASTKSAQMNTSTSSSSMKRSASAPAMELNNNPNDPRRAKSPAAPAAKNRPANDPPPKSKSTRGFWSKYRIHWENLLKL